jgi:hypothetical protein
MHNNIDFEMSSIYAHLRFQGCADTFHQHCATQTFSPHHAVLNECPVSKSPKAVENPIFGPFFHPDEVYCCSFGHGLKAVTFNDGKAAHFYIPFAAQSLRHERPLRLFVSNKADFLYETLEPSLASV